MKRARKLPTFRSDKEEARFWETHSTADYWDEFEDAPEVAFARPPKQVVTLRLDRELVQRLRAIAHDKGIPYCTLIRMWLVERIRKTG